MDKPESAVYDAENDLIYISNIGGEYFELDGNGFIAQVKPDGSIENLKWVEGFNNPQGLALHNGKLYIADLTKVICVDVNQGAIEKEYRCKGAKFFNDVTVDAKGDVYVSDSFANCICRCRDDCMEVWDANLLLEKPNGLLRSKNDLFVLLFEKGILYKENLQTKELTQMCDGISNADGITSDGEGGFFVTGAWQGQIFHLNASGEKELVLDLQGLQTTADITYIPKYHLLIAPTLDKTVVAYKWE